MKKDTEPPGNLRPLRTFIEIHGQQPVTIHDGEKAASFIIEHLPAIKAIHTTPLQTLPQTVESRGTREAMHDG